MERCPKLFFVTLTFITCLCLIESRQLTDIEVLQRTTCEAVYKKAQGNRKDINFTSPIGNLSCKPGSNGHMRYHCMENEDGHFIQFCAEWIWIEPRLCPKLYSLQGVINPVECDKTKDCPADRYQSHDYYKYHACFKITKKNQGTTAEQEKSENQQPDGAMIAGIVIPAIVAVVVVAVLVFVLRKRRMDENRSLEDGARALLPIKGTLGDGTRALLQMKDSFVQERALEAIKASISSKRHILLTGRFGSGVTSLMDQIKKCYQSSTWKTDNHVKLKFGADIDFVHIDHKEAPRNFKTKLVDTLLEMMKKVLGQTIFIITVEYQWFEYLRERMAGQLGDGIDAIDVSGTDLMLTKEEKRKFLDMLCTTESIKLEELSERQRNEIASFPNDQEKYKGFPLLCSTVIDERRFDDPVGFMRRETLMKNDVLVREGPFHAAKIKVESFSSIMVTGLPGSGIKTFIQHLREEIPYYNWEELEYKKIKLQTEEDKNVAVIKENTLSTLESLDELRKLMERPDCACIIHVRHSWYHKSIGEFKEKLGLPFDVIDLSSEKYRLKKSEKLMIIDKLCETQNIEIEELPKEKRDAIASFDEKYCGFTVMLKDLLTGKSFDELETKMNEICDGYK